MENLNVTIANDIEFDRAVHGDDKVPALKEGGDIRIITKNKAMASGRAGAVITFTVDVDGKLRRAQAVVPIRLLKTALAIINSAYDEEGFPREPV